MMTTRALRLFAAATLAGLLSVACGGGNDGMPVNPTAPTPTGCTGSPVSNVTVRLGAMGSDAPARFTAQVFGETVNGTAPPSFLISRNAVPCEYELNVQVAESRLNFFHVSFGNEGRSPEQGGVLPGSIVVLEGPDPRPAAMGQPAECLWEFRGTAPYTIRMRFRVDATIRGGSRCQ